MKFFIMISEKSMPTLQKSWCASISKKRYSEAVVVYAAKHTRHTNTLRRQNAESAMLKLVVCIITTGLKRYFLY
jgi:hypothetical protein